MKYIDTGTGKEYIPDGEYALDPKSNIIHTVMHKGRLVQMTSAGLLEHRGLIVIEDDVIYPSEIILSSEIGNKSRKKSLKDDRTHNAVGDIVKAGSCSRKSKEERRKAAFALFATMHNMINAKKTG